MSAGVGSASHLCALMLPVDRARPDALRAHLKNEIDTLGGLLTKAGVQAN